MRGVMNYVFSIWLGLALGMAQLSLTEPLYWFLLAGGVVFFNWLDRNRT